MLSFQKLIWLFALCLYTTSCGNELSDSKDEKKSTTEESQVEAPEEKTVASSTTDVRRVLADQGQYPYVGVITYKGALRCSGILLQHGVFATAKHCFKSEPSALELLGYEIGFTLDGIFDGSETDVKIAGAKLTELRFDGKGNDIAYFLYLADATEGKVELPTFDVSSEVPLVNAEMELVGFPSNKESILRKLITQDCVRLEREGVLKGPLPADPIVYDGKVFDTDCGAWFGNSGGPLFTVSRNVNNFATPLQVVGVVTHTFDTNENGSILKEAMIEDQFGSFVKTVNFSPFTQATQPELYLDP